MLIAMAVLTLLANAPLVHGQSVVDALFVSAEGNVGIGTTNPASKLDVNGAIKATSITVPTINSTGITTTKLDVNGDLTAGGLEVDGRIIDASGYVMPVGSIVAFYGAIVPEGWLRCNGDPVPSDAKYDELRNLGITKTPDLRGRTLIGEGQGPGLTMRALRVSSGFETHKLTVPEMPSHQHFGFGENWSEWPDGTQGAGKWGSAGARDQDNNLFGTTSEGRGQPHNIMQPYLVVNYIIKY
jgi:microcystin-dependent protein